MLEIKNIKKSYKTGDFKQEVLKDISIQFRENEFVAILGPSGSGKTTLLNILGGLDRYDSGDLIINNKSTKKFKDSDWDAYRNNSVGFVFQNYNLITHISILNNVEMGMTLSNVGKSERRRKALKALELVGLKSHINKKPSQLSGGQMQRVAIARAIVNNPDIILADEPTGALDSKTSVQIMELIKAQAKNKLVIMVTHNEELAVEYATRIIRLKDGCIASDSNPYEKNNETNEEYKLKKTKMSFYQALLLSLNNIKTKKGRTLLTSFAASIGIIGISLVLALSNGFQRQIDNFEKDTLAQMPVVILSETPVTDEKTSNSLFGSNSEKEKYPSDNKVRTLKTFMSTTHKNDFNEEYLNYIKNIDSNKISGLSFLRSTHLNTLIKVDNEIKPFDSSVLMPLPESLNDDSNLMFENFDLLYGTYPKSSNELVLIVNEYNEVDSSIFNALGFKENDTISFENIVKKEIKIIDNDSYYTQVGNVFIPITNYDKVYENSNDVLKIVGVMRGKKDNSFATIAGTGLSYRDSLMTKYIENNKQSKIAFAQENSDYNVLTGQKFGKDLSKDTILTYIGAKDYPIGIYLYPKDFEAKSELLSYLDKYNENKDDSEKNVYTDYASTVTDLSGGIMDGITLVLIAFSSVSLIVSSIMISIITYISVLERTKEIGILRSLGARKKDVTRVFNAETFLIGLSSGLIGILITYLLCVPINIILKAATTLDSVAYLNPVHAIIMVIISIVITLIGGFIPARMAAKKDPVEALRTE